MTLGLVGRVKWKVVPLPGSLVAQMRPPCWVTMLPADGEAEAGAAHGAGVGGVDLLEALEDVFELVGGNAAALIANFDEGFVLVEVLGGEMDLAAGGGELDGV